MRADFFAQKAKKIDFLGSKQKVSSNKVTGFLIWKKCLKSYIPNVHTFSISPDLEVEAQSH